MNAGTNAGTNTGTTEGGDIDAAETGVDDAGAAAGPQGSEKLSKQDLDRVARYLSSPVHQVERKPFRPWLMMGLLVLVVVSLGLLSRLISWFVL